MLELIHAVKFDEHGLIPAVVQDWRDGSVLMLGYMNREAIEKTIASRAVHFWSRSRNRLWEKGETSGHRLVLKNLFLDCDRDAMLVKAEPVGPTCHTGEPGCFYSKVQSGGLVDDLKTTEALGGILDRVYATIEERKKHPQAGSYVTALRSGGRDKILKKIAEEAGEVVIASKNNISNEIIHEVADLFFHTLIVLSDHGIALQEVYDELGGRMGKSGLRSALSEGAK
jgi:phosphoribosyl-ATP pyrophosphohydrolase/phosphoribosyl-AMP cyclohydrolase